MCNVLLVNKVILKQHVINDDYLIINVDEFDSNQFIIEPMKQLCMNREGVSYRFCGEYCLKIVTKTKKYFCYAHDIYMYANSDQTDNILTKVFSKNIVWFDNNKVYELPHEEIDDDGYTYYNPRNIPENLVKIKFKPFTDQSHKGVFVKQYKTSKVTTDDSDMSDSEEIRKKRRLR